MHRVQHQLADLPTKPGVYLFKDEVGKILYVGKAKRLRNRVRSYFQKRTGTDAKLRVLVPKIASIDTIVTSNEVEALLLESNFIKQYRPPYNVRLRDDKHYLFIKVTLGERFPRVTTARRVTARSGERARYFGPYTDGRAVRQTLKTLRKAFPYCLSNDPCDDPSRSRPCLYHHLGLCPSPQYGKISEEAYRRNIDGLMRALDGRTDTVQAMLRQEMQAASRRHAYEQAARLRDRLESLEALLARQQAVDPKLANRDVIGLAREGAHAVALLLTVRQGRIVARKDFGLQGAKDSAEAELLDGFLGQYYKAATSLPDEVLVPFTAAAAGAVSGYLSERRGRKVPVVVPQRGHRRKLLALAQENAAEQLAKVTSRWNVAAARREQGLTGLADALGLATPPVRIECYDISTLGGTSTVGSMTVFRDGTAAPAHYRRFRVAGVQGVDDFASLREVVRRRFKRAAAGTGSGDASFGTLPDLVVIDGGKGQVSAAAGVLMELGLSDLPLIGLAKRFEEVFRWTGSRAEPVGIAADAPGSRLLQEIRDEAHRFAITYGRSTHRKSARRSALDGVPGIGPARKRDLVRAFGSVKGVREASLPAIQAVVGTAAGRAVKENL